MIRYVKDITAIYLRHVKRYEIMKVNSCHIPPRSLTLRSRVVSFLPTSVSFRSVRRTSERRNRRVTTRETDERTWEETDVRTERVQPM